MNKYGLLLIILLVAAFAGCTGKGDTTGQTGADTTKLSGTVKIDGSSTVYPVTEAVAEEFGSVERDVRVTVGISGTGGGFKKFCPGETDISDASRVIKDIEKEKCAKNGVEYTELKIGIDGLSVVVNPENDFADCMTVEELKEVWKPGSTVTTWSDIRAEWPDEKIYLVGPDTDSGTFDYFTEEIVGKAKSSRSDYTASADDNMLVQAIAGEKYALGYFGYAYYVENPKSLKLVAVDSGSGCVKPDATTVKEGTYSPLSRPLFIYVNKKSLKRPEVKAFVDYYMEKSPSLVKDVGYVPLPEAEMQKNRQKVAEAVAGGTK